MPDLFSGIAGLASGLISGIAGIGQKRKANKWLNSHQQPMESVPAEVLQNQSNAIRDAAQGMPSEQYAQAMKNIQRQQLMALRGANDRRGGLMALSGIQQAGNDALLNLDAKSAAIRMANKQNLQNVNNQVAGWKDKVWQNNINNPYQRDRNYNMSLLGMGNQNLFGGLDKGLAGLGGIGMNLFGKKTKKPNIDFDPALFGAAGG